jgi:ribosomal protein L11 methyltransferase
MTQLAKQEYELVLVNIVADVIIGLSPVLPEFLTERSVLICSGILDSRLQDVCSALEKVGLTVVQTKAKEDWRCVMAKRRYA